MKKLLLIITTAVLAMTAAAQPYKGIVEIDCRTVEERDDRLFIDLGIAVDARAMNVTQSWTIIPELRSTTDENVRYFPSVLVNGKNKRQIFERREKFESRRWVAKQPYMMVNIDKYTDTLLNYTFEVPYEPWMDEARLMVRQVLTSCRDQEQLFILALDKVKIQPREPYVPETKLAFVVPNKETVKKRAIQDQAFLDFQVGRSEILPNFRRNAEELSKIDRTLATVTGNSDATLTGMYIEGYASPEGSYPSNLKLSSDRAQALSRHISAKYNIPMSNMASVGMGEDWKGLRNLVEDSNIEYRSEILNLIDTDMDPDRKEQRIRVLGGGRPYQIMLREMYPPLRRVDYRVDFTVRDFTVAESREVMDRDPSMLSHYELYMLSDYYDLGSADNAKVHETILRMFPQEPESYINAAAAFIFRGEYARARNLLEEVPDSPAKLNNLGVAYLMENNTQAAEEMFRRAAAAGNAEANHNLSETELKKEDNIQQERYRNR